MPIQSAFVILNNPQPDVEGVNPRSNALLPHQVAALEHEQYRIIGKHSAVKVCLYTKSALRGGTACYKGRFYGIGSHECVQMSPTVQFCTENCLFCWRTLRYHNKTAGDWDSPEFIVNGMIAEHKRLLSGFGGNDKTAKEKFSEAMLPKHVAISLSGEPTLYPYLPELIEEMHKRGMTTFLVSNGTNPDMIRRLVNRQPTQLYITLAGPTWEILKKTTNPMLDDSWERLMESLSLLRHFRHSVVRMTLVKNLNMAMPETYAELIEAASPVFAEAKGYSPVGGSLSRLGMGYMPVHEEIRAFAEAVAAHSSYQIRDEQPHSRAVLLTKPGQPLPAYGHVEA